MVILVSLPIAGCSLAVSVAAGLTDRKRPFSLLRLTGAPLGVLRRVVALEGAGPLLITPSVSAGDRRSWPPSCSSARSSATRSGRRAPSTTSSCSPGSPPPSRIIASTLPVLDRITGPETARNE